MVSVTRPKPVVLMILDGFGVATPGEGNAISRAKMPVWQKLVTTYPAMVLRAAAQEVGLQFGEMGNSEVGHLTIGAGRVLYQNLPRIDQAIADGEFATNTMFAKAIAHVKEHKSKLHLVGLTSEGGVHSHLRHLLALIDLCAKAKVPAVYVHAILDGRDTLPDVAGDFIIKVQKALKKIKQSGIASLSGRFYAMDRDNNWDRIEPAWRAMVEGTSDHTAEDPLEAIKKSYKQKVLDEEFVPTVITKDSQPVATIADNDAVIFFNFRADRARQLTKAFVLPSFDKFKRVYLPNLFFITMMEYEKDLPVEVAFLPENVDQPLSQVLSQAKLKQLHIAETEKYAHVSFFFNGLKEVVYPGETDVVVSSPKVASYALKPEMSAGEVTDRVVKEIKNGTYDFIVMNYANADMVGHTGNMQATIQGLEFIDGCIGKVVDIVLAKGGVILITADHGNAEEKLNLQTGEITKDHTTNAVPLVIVGRQWEGQTAGLPEGVGADLSLVPPGAMLSDIAPTILKIMKLPQLDEMTGTALL